MIWGTPRKHLTECESTNDVAAEWARTDPHLPPGTIVTADRQTRGRGRRGHGWISTDGLNILLSVIRPLDASQPVPLSLGFGASVAVAQTLEGFGLPGQVKWPNDVVCNGHKLAGILVETVVLDGRSVAIIGIGLNCNQTDFGDTSSFAVPPGSMAIELESRVDREDVLRDLLIHLQDIDTLRRTDGDAAVLDYWRLLMVQGMPQERMDEIGVVDGVDDGGRAIVRLIDGTRTVWETVGN